MSNSNAVLGSLDDVAAKLDWAGKHFEALHSEIRLWAQTNPYTIGVEPEGEASQHSIYVTFTTEPDTRRWGLMFGDAVHNVRAALDHLVYACAIRAQGCDPPPDAEKLQFPILSDGEFWPGECKKRLGGLTEDMRTYIESVQPYKIPGGFRSDDFLWLIRWLDNVSKHRLIQPVGLLPAEFAGSVQPVTLGELKFTFYPVQLKDKATVMTVTGEGIHKVNDDFAASLRIVVPLPDGRPADIDVLTDQIFGSTAEMLVEFGGRFFPEWSP